MHFVSRSNLTLAAGLALGMLFLITGWGVYGILAMVLLVTCDDDVRVTRPYECSIMLLWGSNLTGLRLVEDACGAAGTISPGGSSDARFLPSHNRRRSHKRDP